MSENEPEEIKIRGEFTPDPQVCRFAVNRPLLAQGVAAFGSADEAAGSPLAEALFAIDGIGAVRVNASTLILTKQGDAPWPKIAAQLIPVVRERVQAGGPLFSESVLERAAAGPDREAMGSAINELFEQHINPALASHGGWVRLNRIEGRDVYLEMGGGCQGCSMSQATLKNGIEKAIRDALPEVGEIFDATDHEAGVNPYYT